MIGDMEKGSYKMFSQTVMMLLMSASLGTGEVVGTAAARGGGALLVDNTLIRLAGISAPGVIQYCENAGRVLYACGRLSEEALASIVAGRRVTCKLLPENREVGSCSVANQDIAEALLQNGYVVTSRSGTSLRYRQLAKSAKRARRGLWQGRFLHPEDWAVGVQKFPVVRQ